MKSNLGEICRNICGRLRSLPKSTWIFMCLSAVLLVALIWVSVLLGMKDGNANQGSSDTQEPFHYMTAPISNDTDETEASKRLVEFTRNEYLTKEVVKVGDNIYVGIGWALANSIMIEGDDGVIIVDTTESADSMRSIMAEFRNITKKPVVAIIFTHFHTGDTYEIGFKRGLRQVGGLLKPQDPPTGSGLGPFLALNTNADLDIPMPNVTFRDRANYTISGIEVELIHTPGETDDQITVWLPKQRAALPGDNIYKTFPNLYAIRGSPARDSKRWYGSVEQIRNLKPIHLVMSHTQPVTGEDAVSDALSAYRDGIKYVHDQTLRLLNKGMYPSQIVDEVRLPDQLARHPFLQEHYGTVHWSVRGIFANYLGWFSGNPRDLDPLTEYERSTRLQRLIAYAQASKSSPTEVMLQHAQISHNKSHNHYLATGRHIIEDDKWALDLADAVLVLSNTDQNMTTVATQIKVSALTAIGVEEVSPNGRNYFLTNAMETALNLSIERTKSARAYVIQTSSTDRVLGILCAKVNGLVCQYKNFSVKFSFLDDEDYGVTLRNSVCDVIRDPTPDFKSDLHMSTNSSTLKSIYADETDLHTELNHGTVSFLNGTENEYNNFIQCFDKMNAP